MAEEQYVSRDQHRADLAELRLEMANTLASLDKRTELIAQDLLALRREMAERFEQVERRMAEDRETMLLRFEHMDQRFEQVDQRFEQVDQRFEQVDQRFEQVNQRFEQVNQRFEHMDQRFEQVNQQFEQVNQQLARHETRLLSLENWMRTTFVTLALVAIGVAAQLFYTLLRFGLQSPTP
jgi:chromosome segregation ATPase